MTWWLWIILGFLFAVGEIVSAGTFYLIFFALGAVSTGALVGAGFIVAEWVAWSCFTVVSLSLILTLRRKLLAHLAAPAEQESEFAGKSLIVKTETPAGELGQGNFYGTAWRIKNEGGRDLYPGDRVEIIGRVGLTLLVKRRVENPDQSSAVG